MVGQTKEKVTGPKRKGEERRGMEKEVQIFEAHVQSLSLYTAGGF